MVGVAGMLGRLIVLDGLAVLQSLGLIVVFALHVLELLRLLFVDLLLLLNVWVWRSLDFLLLLNLTLFEFLAFGVLLRAQLFELLLLLLLDLRIHRSGHGARVWRAVVVAACVGGRVDRRRILILLRSDAGRRLIWTRCIGIHSTVNGLAVVQRLARARSIVVDGRLARSNNVVVRGLTGTGRDIVRRLRLNWRNGMSDWSDAHVIARHGVGGGCVTCSGALRLRRASTILRGGDRAAAVGTDGGFLAVDIHWCRRRRSLRHDGAGLDRGGRPHCCGTTGADEGLAVRRDRRRTCDNVAADDLSLVDANDVARNVLSGNEGRA